jgi:hypothetical protein
MLMPPSPCRILLVVLLSMAATLRCSVATHAGEYQVGGLCAMCPSRPDLRHAPCRSGKGVGGAAADVYYFAMRSIDLGADPSEWVDGYWVGLNQDCSDRPGGMPVLCNSPTKSPSLPGGVDNALATTLATVVNGARLGDPIQRNMNAEIGGGKWGLLLVLDDWNGTADDDSVGVRLLYTRGAVAADGGSVPPRWDGADFWDAYYVDVDPNLPGVPDTAFKGGTAYVASGHLVWDARSVIDEPLRLENNAVGGVGAIELVLANLRTGFRRCPCPGSGPARTPISSQTSSSATRETTLFVSCVQPSRGNPGRTPSARVGSGRCYPTCRRQGPLRAGPAKRYRWGSVSSSSAQAGSVRNRTLFRPRRRRSSRLTATVASTAASLSLAVSNGWLSQQASCARFRSPCAS